MSPGPRKASAAYGTDCSLPGHPAQPRRVQPDALYSGAGSIGHAWWVAQGAKDGRTRPWIMDATAQSGVDGGGSTGLCAVRRPLDAVLVISTDHWARPASSGRQDEEST